MSDLTLQELAPGAMAALGGYCNCGLIANRGHALVIDSGICVAEATALYAAARQYQPQGEPTLFNTHHHGDHVFGNQVFANGSIIAQQGAREAMARTGEQTLALWKQDPDVSEMLSDVTMITLPSITFQESLTIFVGELEVQLLHLGAAHSSSDSVAWLPASRTLFAGDLLFNSSFPGMPPEGDSANWIRVLKRLEQLNPRHVVPGHGPIQPPEALRAQRTWIEELRTRVANEIAHWDRETSVAKMSAELQSLSPRAREDRLPTAIKSVYAELTGQLTNS
ncbi:MBL fold metallo-hydrolase [Ktedonosporobacter rubrisoli]|uniref:MBL fold metallo-hydrolase n=1 Tax=Ktedonosporobacter rubrisoli TaxID=2509675 RepID=A0A4P6JYF3_KTERU|nr:MBL fold metallo-hydrolase [Ktedonosporobacter rubrisoli]QBD80829.1 MBL fold metallo-hydrolase [Ktedonosporobacter rubrisoli]